MLNFKYPGKAKAVPSFEGYTDKLDDEMLLEFVYFLHRVDVLHALGSLICLIMKKYKINYKLI